MSSADEPAERVSTEPLPPRAQSPLRSRRSLLGAAVGAVGVALFCVRRALRGDDDDVGAAGPSRVRDAQPLPPYRPPELDPRAPLLSFLALGDIGLPGPARDGVVAAMDRAAATLPFAFVCLLGDNFYDDGVDEDGVASTEDPRWRTGFEDVFAGPNLAVPFQAALGNHDHNGNPDAQVEYSARDTRWRMPGKYYSFVAPIDEEHHAQFFVLDTESLRREERDGNEQLRWFEDKLSRSSARWKIVIGHHPVRSNGEHGGIDRVRAAVEPLLERHGVALYLSGHDHDIELIETRKGFLQVVSGAGSGTRDMRWGDDTRFASAAPGFAWVGLGRDELQLVFVDSVQGPLRTVRYERSELVPTVELVPG